MLKTRKLILSAIAATVLAVAGFAIWGAGPAAPPVTFVSIEGEKITTESLRGRVVLVNFWATDCVTCIKEMPAITATYGKYRDRGFETIAVAMRHDPPNYVLDYVAKNRLPFKVALDPLGELARAFDDVRLTPTTLVINKRGKIVARILGEPDFAKLHALIERELAES